MKRVNKIFFVLIFILGLALVSYPPISQFLYEKKANEVIKNYEIAKKNMNEDEINRKHELAVLYNETLKPRINHDPFSQKEKLARKEYAKMLKINEQIGHIEIPQINQDLPMYAGTSEKILQIGAGHLEGTSLPVGGKNTHCVITAHRGLPSKELFRNLDKLKKGDVFFVHNIKEKLCYQVIKTEVIKPDDLDKVRVVEGEDLVTLLTCHPYMINSERLLVTGKRIELKDSFKNLSEKKKMSWILKQIIKITIFILFVALSLYLINRHFKKKYNDGL